MLVPKLLSCLADERAHRIAVCVCPHRPAIFFVQLISARPSIMYCAMRGLWMTTLPEPLRCLAEASSIRAYLVGGAVRDLMLGRPVTDWDVAADDACAAAQIVAQYAGRNPVQMHPSPATFRIPLPDGHIDVVQLTADDLVVDLSRRDFTVNAMAIELREGAYVIDPFGGMKHLRAGIIETVSETSMRDDPVRVVRAYRLAAELGFRIGPRTREQAKKAARWLQASATQRWGHELLRLFDTPLLAGPAVEWMEADGVLEQLFPYAEEMRGIGRGGFHHKDVLGHTLEALRHADRLLEAPRSVFVNSAERVGEYLKQRFARCTVRAAVLLHDIGKPATYHQAPDGRVTFYDHDDVGAAMAEDELRRWAWPKALRQAVVRLVDIHMRPLQLARAHMEDNAPITDRALRHLANDAGEHLPALFLVSAADLMAARGPASTPEEHRQMLQLLDEMLHRAVLSTVAHPRQRLINGHDLMRGLGLSPGPLLGSILNAVHAAQDEGRIRTRAEALSLARQLLAHGRAGIDVGDS